MSDLTNVRQLALSFAVDLFQGLAAAGFDPTEVTSAATEFWRFLTAPIVLVVTARPALDQTTGHPTGNPGGSSVVAIKDTEKFELVVTAVDAKGDATAPPTDVTFTVDNTTVITIAAPDSNGKVVAIAGSPGSAVITGTWPDSPAGPITGTLAVDVTAGPAASLVIAAGDVVAQ